MDMERSRGEDPRLSEVKAVLQRLQRISADPQADTLDHTASQQAPRPRRLALAAAAGVAAAVLIAGGAFVLTDPSRFIGSTVGRLRQPPAVAPAPTAPQVKLAAAPSGDASLPPLAVQPATSQRPVLEAAIGLLNAGRVQVARRQLLAIASEDAADVAWALARSYDPNFLATIPGADAEPDIAAATRWYRAWHAAALRQGLVTEGVSLERILGSMR
jgi:hypothetical protein